MAQQPKSSPNSKVETKDTEVSLARLAQIVKDREIEIVDTPIKGKPTK